MNERRIPVDWESACIRLQLSTDTSVNIASKLDLLEFGCPECPNEYVIVGRLLADGPTVKRWFNCPDCGYEAPSRIVYGAEQ